MELTNAKTAGKPLKGSLARVYLFEGKEDLQKQEALAKLTAQALDTGGEAFDLEIYEGKELTAGRLFTAASLLPFTSPKRMVVVRRANAIPSEEQEAIARKLEQLPESAVVVFLVPSPDLNKQGQPKKGSSVIAKFSKAVASAGAAIAFNPLKPDEAAGEIARRVSTRGKNIDSRAARRLVERIGVDLSILDTEAQKLVDYIGDREQITVQDVDEVTGESPEERIWKLLDAVGARNHSAALGLLKLTLESGAGPEKEGPRVLAMILRQLRLIWQARSLADQGQRLQRMPEDTQGLLPSDTNVLAICRRNSFQARRLDEQARNFTLDDLEHCFELCAAADLTMKGIEGDIEDTATTLELLVANLCRRRRTTQTRGSR